MIGSRHSSVLLRKATITRAQRCYRYHYASVPVYHIHSYFELFMFRFKLVSYTASGVLCVSVIENDSTGDRSAPDAFATSSEDAML